MKPHYEDNHIRIFSKDCRSMDELPDESIQMVCTSPPYWGLRKYSGEQELIWGGAKDCEHQWDIQKISLLHENRNFQTGTQEEVLASGSPLRHTHKTSELRAGFCSLCGAWKGAYGLEPTPDMYIEHTIEILREIKRVLRKDGVVFWNIGDSYASQGGPQIDGTKQVNGSQVGAWGGESRKPSSGLKPKDLCLIPFKVAIIAQEDGWWVRSVIIWSKPNPMPESVKDRPTESHEYILMLTKSARYYWDQDAVREPYSPTERWGGDIYKGAIARKEYNQGLDRERNVYPNTGRNIRTVWEFPTKPGPSGAVRNFAVFPEKLPDICIKAATPEVGCCSKCGAPWERIIDRQVKGELEDRPYCGDGQLRSNGTAGGQGIQHSSLGQQDKISRETLGWQPTCKCNANKVPSIVLDPFLGAGTTLWVAKKLNRMAVGYELSREYCDLSVDRCQQQVFLQE